MRKIVRVEIPDHVGIEGEDGELLSIIAKQRLLGIVEDMSKKLEIDFLEKGEFGTDSSRRKHHIEIKITQKQINKLPIELRQLIK